MASGHERWGVAKRSYNWHATPAPRLMQEWAALWTIQARSCRQQAAIDRRALALPRAEMQRGDPMAGRPVRVSAEREESHHWMSTAPLACSPAASRPAGRATRFIWPAPIPRLIPPRAHGDLQSWSAHGAPGPPGKAQVVRAFRRCLGARRLTTSSCPRGGLFRELLPPAPHRARCAAGAGRPAVIRVALSPEAARLACCASQRPGLRRCKTGPPRIRETGR